MKSRTLKGYRLVYKPNHPNAMVSSNWKGYIYEHIYVASQDIKRPLRKDEEVHHLDFNKLNNDPRNLIVLTKSAHRKLHKWLENGAPMLKSVGANSVNSKKPKLCPCGNTLYGKLKKFCSAKCKHAYTKSKMDKYSIEEVISKFLELKSYVQVGKHYGISDNGLRKWLITQGYNKATLSQALSTLKEGAETSGEV